MATVVVPFRAGGKTRLPDEIRGEVALAMLGDVLEAATAFGPTRLVTEDPAGSLVATSWETTYTASGLNPGQTYSFAVAALDVAGNWSPQTASVDETLPSSEIWMELSPTSFDFGSMDPGTSSAITSGTVVTVGGVGLLNYDLTCSAQDFTNTTTPTATPTMPVGFMSYAIRGWQVAPATPFTTTCRMPAAAWFGAKVAPRSANAAGSKIARSAQAPTRMVPRSGRPSRPAAMLAGAPPPGG